MTSYYVGDGIVFDTQTFILFVFLSSSIDPVTGGPSKGAEPSPLDHMTEEEKEREAGKLSELFDRLNR